MVGATGLEPAASWSQTKHSTKLSYAPAVGPCDSQIIIPQTSDSVKHFLQEKTQAVNAVTYGLWNGAPGGIRTRDLLIRSQTLYPTELRAHLAVLCDVISRDNVYDYSTGDSVCQHLFSKKSKIFKTVNWGSRIFCLPQLFIGLPA